MRGGTNGRTAVYRIGDRIVAADGVAIRPDGAPSDKIAGDVLQERDARGFLYDRAQEGEAPRAVRITLARNEEQGAVLWAETYSADMRSYDRAITHFAANIHAQVEALGMQLGTDGFPHQPQDVQELYLSAVSLARSRDVDALLAARARLDSALRLRPAFALARSLRARVDALLVIGHGRDRSVARPALVEAQALVAAHPEVPMFRHALATAQIALGDLPGALRNLEVAQRSMPFLRRDIAALKRRMEPAGNPGSA